MSSNNYRSRNVLVTGGAGFIGSNYIRYLLASDPNINVINLDLLTYAGSLKNLKSLPNESHYVFIQGDITHSKLVEKILRDYKIDTIVHFAAESHVDRSISGPAPFIYSNIVGTFALLEAARHYWLEQQKWDASCCRFHHISTDEVYGSLSLAAAPFNENSSYAPHSPYSASKAGSDHLVRAYFHTYQLPMTISHCSNNYGPYQHLEKFIPTIINACLTGKPIPIYGDGSNIRDWLYVEDHCAGILTIITSGQVGETYNLGGDFEINNLQLAGLICRLMDELYPKSKSYRELISFASDRPGHDWRYAMDTTKIKNELGWRPYTDFEEGMRKTITYWLKEYLNFLE